jgi:small neutral amino acid transporter SnatA (MarC family)
MPIFISFTREATKKEKRIIIFQSMMTSGILSIGFVFLGKAIFRVLGIELGHP